MGKQICHKKLKVRARYWGRSSFTVGEYLLPENTILEVSSPTLRGTGEERSDVKIPDLEKIDIELPENIRRNDPALTFTATWDDIQEATREC